MGMLEFPNLAEFRDTAPLIPSAAKKQLTLNLR